MPVPFNVMLIGLNISTHKLLVEASPLKFSNLIVGLNSLFTKLFFEFSFTHLIEVPNSVKGCAYSPKATLLLSGTKPNL